MAKYCQCRGISSRESQGRPGKRKGRPASVLIIAISLFNEIGGAFKAPDESQVLFEAVWLESPASQSGLAKVVEGFGRSPLQPLKALEALAASWKRACFFALWPGFGTLTALKALGRGPGRPSWRLLERPPAAPARKHEAPPEQMDHALGF